MLLNMTGTHFLMLRYTYDSVRSRGLSIGVAFTISRHLDCIKFQANYISSTTSTFYHSFYFQAYYLKGRLSPGGQVGD